MKKLTSIVLASLVVFSTSSKVFALSNVGLQATPTTQTNASPKIEKSSIFSQISAAAIITGAIGSTAAGMAPRILDKIWDFGISIYDRISEYFEVRSNEGFREPKEIIKRLEKVAEGTNEIRVYDQEKAKEQTFDALSGAIARIDNIKRGKNNVKETRGNILYISGPSGTGKTKLCYAIADACLNNAEKTTIFCHSESITGEAELGTQLFKTITAKDIGERRSKNILGNDGLMSKDEESAALKHLLKWPECVVIIDEYEKMKKKSAKPGTTMNVNGMTMPIPGAIGAPVDNSADEIFRSIASTGKYKFMNKEIDCSKVLFLLTTNETRAEIEANFGIEGIKGGGMQRLNIIEFDYLSIEACRGIADDVVKDITNILTDKSGPFKLKYIKIDDNSLENMANYIFDDKIMQGRAKNKLEDKIYSLFSKNMGKEEGMSVKLSFNGERFAKNIL